MFAWREPVSVSTRGRPSWGPNVFEHDDVGEEFVLDGLVQGLELRHELGVKVNDPRHPNSMAQRAYGVNDILRLCLAEPVNTTPPSP